LACSCSSLAVFWKVRGLSMGARELRVALEIRNKKQ